MTRSNHLALHLAHRWFAFLEAPGADLATHLGIFHPNVQLSGHGGSQLFASSHNSLVDWFAAVPDAISSHHIVHSNFVTAANGDGLLNMVVAYQAPAGAAMHGSIISYETRINFAADGPRFVALDKTPILANKRLDYQTSWSANRVLARVHAELAGIGAPDARLPELLGEEVLQVSAQVAAPEASREYEAIVTSVAGQPAVLRAVRLYLSDDPSAIMPLIRKIERL
jgi:hypothetical protein